MKKNSTLVVLVALLAAVAHGCMEEPNPVGSRILPPSDLLQLDTVTIVASGSSTVRQQPNSDSPLNILVGKTNEYEAWALLRFTPIPDTLVLTNLIDAQINLRTAYHFGDSLATLSFDVHQIQNSWEGDSLTIDSLTMPGFFDPMPSSSFQMSAVSDTATISIPIDTTLVGAWFNSPLDTVTTNWGVLLKPTNTGVIKGFATTETQTSAYYPELVARYTRSGSTQIDTVRLTGSIATFTAFTANTSWLSDSSHIYVHNGIASRGLADFNISLLPPKATIHKAVLELVLDPLASRLNSHTRDSVYGYYVDTAGTMTAIIAVSEPAAVNGQTVFRLSVTFAVQFWTRNNEINKIGLGGYTENYTLDSFAFYSSRSAYKPKLIITYSPVQ